ncbi:SAP domain-containing protein [Clostridium beijerinckii]|uniref:SAP domain-containing protein n=1 Tax=Clostridium beijerinckii TaxID=1520 RepID=UPI00047C4494|nr:SAP domain-containing protein [Clostridium beijerinckii]
MECKHCGIKMDNPILFYDHEDKCLDEQRINGLIKNEGGGQPPVDYNSMTVDQLKELCKSNNLEGYTALNKDDLIKFVQENIK